MNYKNYYFGLMAILALFLNNSLNNLFFLLSIVGAFTLRKKYWNFENWLLAHLVLKLKLSHWA